MFNLPEVFKDRIASDFARVSREKALQKLHDPFAELSDGDWMALGKIIRQEFEVGDRVRVNAPEHHFHGQTGKVSDAANGIEVTLDSGHRIRCNESDLVPEDFHAAPKAGEKIAKSVKVGGRVVLPDGRHGTITRFAAPPGSAHDSPTLVHVAVDGDWLGIGVDIEIDELRDADESENRVELRSGTMRVSTESQPDADKIEGRLATPLYAEEPLTKATKTVSSFSAGDTVIEKSGERRRGKVLRISPGGLAEVRYGPGLTGMAHVSWFEAAD